MPTHDLIVIGAGPGGYVAAIRAAQLGMNVACIEQEPALGGTCLRIGCIPSKALLESSERFYEAKKGMDAHGVKLAGVSLDLATMLKRKDGVVNTLTKGVEGLFKKNKVTRYLGHGKITGPGRVTVESKDGKTELESKNILIATGSKSATLPGIEFDPEGRVGTSTDGLSYSEVPKRLIVIGAGYIGVELGSVWCRLGSDVTILEFLDRIMPGSDLEIATEAQKILEKQGLKFRLGARVKGARYDAAAKECIVEIEGSEPVRADRVLVAVGRKPNTENLGLDTVGIAVDKRGFVTVNEHWLTTAQCGAVYAIGDVIPGPMLAHKAEEEGVAVAEFIATGYGHVDYNSIPGVVYTDPEIASVGKTEEQLKDAGVKYKKGVFPFLAIGRARAIARTEGKVKILADAATDRVLGVHIVGAHAGDLIAECAAAMAFGASSEDIARVSHAHPTLAEAVKEAAMAVDGRAIHI